MKNKEIWLNDMKKKKCLPHYEKKENNKRKI